MADSPLITELRSRMAAEGFNQKSLARAANLNETAVRDILKGRSQNPRIDTLEALARTLGCSVSELTGRGRATPPANWTDKIDVIGATGGGVVRNSVVRPPDDWYPIVAPKDSRFENRPRFALEVEGEASGRFYRDGDLLICVHPEELGRGFSAGDRLVVRVPTSGRESQFVVGEFQTDKEGQSWYWLGSGGEGRMSKSDAPGIEIIAVVVGSYRRE